MRNRSERIEVGIPKRTTTRPVRLFEKVKCKARVPGRFKKADRKPWRMKSG